MQAELVARAVELAKELNTISCVDYPFPASYEKRVEELRVTLWAVWGLFTPSDWVAYHRSEYCVSLRRKLDAGSSFEDQPEGV